MAKKSKPQRKCAECRYFAASTKLRGRCRIDPPQVPGPKDNGVWPMVSAADWCGKFKAKKAT